jgi:hypothetical protein
MAGAAQMERFCDVSGAEVHSGSLAGLGATTHSSKTLEFAV